MHTINSDKKKLKIGQYVIKNKYDGFNNSLENCRGERMKAKGLNIHNSISECFQNITSGRGSIGVCFTRLWLFEGTWGATIVCVTQKAFELLVSVSREKGLEVIIGLAGTTQRNRFGNIFGNKYLSSLFGQSTLLPLRWYLWKSGLSGGYRVLKETSARHFLCQSPSFLSHRPSSNLTPVYFIVFSAFLWCRFLRPWDRPLQI